MQSLRSLWVLTLVLSMPCFAQDPRVVNPGDLNSPATDVDEAHARLVQAVQLGPAVAHGSAGAGVQPRLGRMDHHHCPQGDGDRRRVSRLDIARHRARAFREILCFTGAGRGRRHLDDRTGRNAARPLSAQRCIDRPQLQRRAAARAGQAAKTRSRHDAAQESARRRGAGRGGPPAQPAKALQLRP